MDWLWVVLIATAAAVGGGIAYTVRAFKHKDVHDGATIELLKRFFDGKTCAICKRPIPPVHLSGLKPGLLNPATHETYSWDEIPTDNLATLLETALPLCAACEVAESFRKRFPDLVLDRDRSIQDAQPHGRIETSS